MAVVYGDNTASFGKTAMLKACYIKWGTAMPRLLTPASCHTVRPQCIPFHIIGYFSPRVPYWCAGRSR